MRVDQVVGHEIGTLIRDVVPPWLVPVFILITHLGNVGFFLVLFTLDYWFGDHERGAHAISLAIGGMALITALKYFFAAPRPPEAVTVIAIGGYAFPSGHATGATIAYGILAYDLEVGSPRWRYPVAGLIIVLIALSRVVLGVHFVRDVVAGIAVGLVFLVVAAALTEHAPRQGFLLAIALAVVALAISAASHDGVAVLGAATGAALTWISLDPVPKMDTRREQAVLVGAVLPVLAGVGYVSTLSGLPLTVVFALNALLLAAILVAPLLVARVD